jgi:hypothetical protein
MEGEARLAKKKRCEEGCVDGHDHRQHATVEHRYEGGRQQVEEYEMSSVDGVFEEIKNVRGRYDDRPVKKGLTVGYWLR